MDDQLSQGAFRNGQANRRGIRTATVRFGAFYLLVLVLIVAGFLSSVDELAVNFLLLRLLQFVSLIALAIGQSALIYRIHERLTRRMPSEDTLPILIIGALAFSILSAAVWAGAHQFYPALLGTRQPTPGALDNFGGLVVISWGFLFGWSCLFVTLVFAFELNDRKLRLAAIREEALSAQMRALRYQINPHFLFNTLNSVAGLIEEGAANPAQHMVMSLSTFLRTTLAIDPFQDVTLADEIALQEEYLGIERVRFSDRMSFSIDMAPEVGGALVPSLILQPLIENAVKHGVGRARGQAGIALTASRRGERLCVTIINDMPAPPLVAPAPAGMGVGVANVDGRLRARFGDEFALQSGPDGNGRFVVRLELPWRLA